MYIYTLRELIDFYKKRNTTVFVTFMDASKAFDRIDHWLLFDKLLARKIPLFIIRIFIFWYSQQSMCIRWGNTLSASFKVTNGVKQGGILSPTLFNVYMDNLSILLNSSNIGGRIGDQLINHLCYADDLCLISLSSAGMQQLLHICNQYAADHHLLYNGLKSFSMCFKPKTIKFNQPEFYLENRIIPSVTQCKYLGIMIDVKNCDIDMRQMRNLYANVNLLLRKFSKCSVEMKCFLFKTYCSNIYCGPLWYNSTKTAMKRLKIAYNNSLRRLLGIPKYCSASEMFVCLNIRSFDEMLRKYVLSFKSRIIASKNSLLICIINSPITLFSSIWAWWSSILMH